MPYVLGIDLGTTYTAAATHRDGRAQIASIGSRSAAIPSVVFLRQDEEVLTGEAADRRALSEPGRVAREFKRRVGDTTPIMVGSSPYSAEQLSAELLKAVVGMVTRLEGSRPEHIALCHPANWGPYKKELLQ
ncbi:MAG: molecular chaperone DnaK, partial [Acidimicrobiaceae bacterium]